MKPYNSINLFSEIKEVPAVLDQKTYPSLNGLRAISILMVVIYHFSTKYGYYLGWLIFIGPLGVNIFFVVSGFLITSLCIKEKVITNDLSLKNFYIRRALRILPLAYLYIFAIVVLNYIFKLDIAIVSVISSMLFLVNISYFQKIKFDWDLAHYWTLSAEEQFYILFPVFIKKKFNVYITLLLIICFAVPIGFYLQSIIPILNTGILSSALRYLVKFQAISIGCLSSVLLFKGYLNFGKAKLIMTLISIFMICYLHIEPGFTVKICLRNLAISIFSCLIVVNNIQPQNNLIFKFLNLKILNFIGLLSYSIYIWQQIFVSNDPKFALSKYPINLVFLIIIPCLSYFFYERFFLNLKARFIKVPAIYLDPNKNSGTQKRR